MVGGGANPREFDNFRDTTYDCQATAPRVTVSMTAKLLGHQVMSVSCQNPYQVDSPLCQFPEGTVRPTQTRQKSRKVGTVNEPFANSFEGFKEFRLKLQ